ncbi:MAG: hypothetical protein AAGC81_10290 [Pseudomonadota bacterium]
MTQRTELLHVIDEILGGTLGAIFRFMRSFVKKDQSSPLRGATEMGGVFLLLFAILPGIWAWFVIGNAHPMNVLSLWGAVYLWYACLTAQITSDSVESVIADIVAPNLAESTCGEIARELLTPFNEARVSIVSLAFSTVFAVITWIALMYDIGSWQESDNNQSSIRRFEMIQITWCVIGFFLLYIVAARATFVGFFYLKFANVIRRENAESFPLDPAHAVLIRGIGLIGKRMLLFWIGIALSVATLPLLFPGFTYFLLFVVPTAVLFSLICGSFVFLTAEADLRHVVSVQRSRQLRALEEEIKTLFDRRSQLDKEGWAQLENLQSLRKQLLETGNYRNDVLSFLSVIAPLFAPILTLLMQYQSLEDGWAEIIKATSSVLSAQ